MTQITSKPPAHRIAGRRSVPAWVLWSALILLIAIHATLSLSAASTKSLTYDEPLHITAGTSYWVYNDYRLQPENGNLPQRAEGLPGVLLERDSFITPEALGWQRCRLFDLADQWFDRLGSKMDRLILTTRCVTLLFSIATALIVFFWSRVLFGDRAAMMSLTLYAFCPTMLAHGTMITSDMCAGLCFLAAIAAAWWMAHRLTPGRVILAGLLLGAVALSKFSGPIMGGLIGILIFVRCLGRSPLVVSLWNSPLTTLRPRSPRMVFSLIGASFIVGLVAYVCIWASFDFRFEMVNPTAGLPALIKMPDSWDVLIPGSGSLGPLIVWARDHRVLPEGYLYGFAYVLKHAAFRPAFFNGSYSTKGWPLFFPYAFMVKTPLATIALILLALGALGWRLASVRPGRRVRRAIFWVYRTAPLWLLVGVYFAAAVNSHINIGQRHLLPIYAPLYVLGGAAAWWFSRRSTWMGTLTATMTLYLIIEIVGFWPNYLAYFNPVDGGPRQAYKHLIDSSLDWGQELPAFRRWLDERGLNQAMPEPPTIPDSQPASPLATQPADTTAMTPSTPVYFYYFGSDRPKRFGINPPRLPMIFTPLEAPPEPLKPGYYCVCATNFEAVYGAFPGHWEQTYEDEYKLSYSSLLMYNATAPGSPERENLIKSYSLETWHRVFSKYNTARAFRLMAWLREHDREPQETIGYSILIFRLTQQDLNEALLGPVTIYPSDYK